ncbi:MAG: hypothetical protein CXZ00_16455 [Acidobacteria bacterium]|nr:MAG: hypothetical protein CXZ00_16455 [Acidobacteriota bacterium]
MVENLPQPDGSAGKARDLAAAKVGLSGKTVDAKKGGPAEPTEPPHDTSQPGAAIRVEIPPA